MVICKHNNISSILEFLCFIWAAQYCVMQCHLSVCETLEGNFDNDDDKGDQGQDADGKDDR